MRYRLVTLAGVLYLAALAPSAYAHHGHPYFYDECNSPVKGTRKGRFKNRTPGSFSGWTTEQPIPSIGLRLSRLTNQGVIGPAKEALVFGRASRDGQSNKRP